METRKKSVDLYSLGLVRRKSNAHRSVSNSSTTSPPHPAKRQKRESDASFTVPKSPKNSLSAHKDRRPIAQATPPPSPDDFPHHGSSIDKSGIKDDIVLGVVEQLESCGNVPLMIKALANILLQKGLPSVQSSSNPVAIISSRLTNFLRRPWTAEAPCPLAKEQVNIQPRRVYYYLTTCVRQPIPLQAENPALNNMRIISPSISSGPDDLENGEQALDVDREEPKRERDILSPSPELDLSAPDFYTGHHSHSMSFSETPQYQDLYGTAFQQAASPPLEHEEREFEQTVNDMATRRAGEQAATPSSNPDPPALDHVDQHDSDAYLAMGDEVAVDQAMGGQEEETEEMRQQRNHEAASALFGGEYGRLSVNTTSHMALSSSPMMQPSIGTKNMPPPVRNMCFGSIDDDAAWHELKSPDCVDMSEIDDLLGGT